MTHTLDDITMVKQCLLPTLECIYGSIGSSIPEIRAITKRFPYSSEEILCINKSTSIHQLKKTFEKPLCGHQNSKIYMVDKRNNVERFSDKIQLIVGAIIHDDTKVLYLEALNQKTIYREHNYTMVLGHVGVDDSIMNSCTPEECFRINLAKEVSEELRNKYMNQEELFNYFLTTSDVRYIGILNSNEVPISNKHILIAYDIHVDDVDEFISNEPEKHVVMTIDIDKIHTIYERLDNFFLKSLSSVQIFKDKYLSFLYHIDKNA